MRESRVLSKDIYGHSPNVNDFIVYFKKDIYNRNLEANLYNIRYIGQGYIQVSPSHAPTKKLTKRSGFFGIVSKFKEFKNDGPIIAYDFLGIPIMEGDPVAVPHKFWGPDSDPKLCLVKGTAHIQVHKPYKASSLFDYHFVVDITSVHRISKNEEKQIIQLNYTRDDITDRKLISYHYQSNPLKVTVSYLGNSETSDSIKPQSFRSVVSLKKSHAYMVKRLTS